MTIKININIDNINKGYNEDFLNLVFIKDLHMFYFYLKTLQRKYNKNDFENFQLQLENLLNDNRIKFIDYLTINSILIDLIDNTNKTKENDINTMINIYKQVYYESKISIE